MKARELIEVLSGADQRALMQRFVDLHLKNAPAFKLETNVHCNDVERVGGPQECLPLAVVSYNTMQKYLVPRNGQFKIPVPTVDNWHIYDVTNEQLEQILNALDSSRSLNDFYALVAQTGTFSRWYFESMKARELIEVLGGKSYRFGPTKGLWHLSFDENLRGNYDLKRAGSAGGTMYGRGLNVTTEPDAWRIIAKLGGATPLKVNLPAGKGMLDVYSLPDPEKQPEFMQWARKRGAVITAHRVYTTDEEGAERYSDFEDAEQARAEQGDRIEQVQAVRAGQQWPLYWEFVRSKNPRIIGLWFKDLLDPYGYSAPHGVIYDPSGVTFSPA